LDKNTKHLEMNAKESAEMDDRWKMAFGAFAEEDRKFYDELIMTSEHFIMTITKRRKEPDGPT